jgi:hypothetical protein
VIRLEGDPSILLPPAVPGLVQLVYHTASVQFLSHDISNQIANHHTDVGESLGIKLVLHKELDQQEICFPIFFPTVQWALDHCLPQLNNDERTNQQMTKYYDAENDEWSEYEKVEQSPIVFVI